MTLENRKYTLAAECLWNDVLTEYTGLRELAKEIVSLLYPKNPVEEIEPEWDGRYETSLFIITDLETKHKFAIYPLEFKGCSFITLEEYLKYVNVQNDDEAKENWKTLVNRQINGLEYAVRKELELEAKKVIHE